MTAIPITFIRLSQLFRCRWRSVQGVPGPGPAHGAALPELLTPAEVAIWLKTTVGAVYAKAERGTLPGATRLGRRLYFVRAELLRWVEQGRVPHLGGPSGGS